MFDSAGRSEGRRKGALGSLLVHLGMAGLVLAARTSPVVKQITHDSINIFAPAFKPPPQAKVGGGGGGGGDRSQDPPDQGVLPRLASETFVPPEQVIRNPDPKLAVRPTIDIAQDLHVTSNLQQYGNPMDGRALPSNGPGTEVESAPARAAGSDPATATGWARVHVAIRRRRVSDWRRRQPTRTDLPARP